MVTRLCNKNVKKRVCLVTSLFHCCSKLSPSVPSSVLSAEPTTCGLVVSALAHVCLGRFTTRWLAVSQKKDNFCFVIHRAAEKILQLQFHHARDVAVSRRGKTLHLLILLINLVGFLIYCLTREEERKLLCFLTV